MIRIICLTGLLCCTPMVARCAEMTVADLQVICAGADEGPQNACRFYILGVADGGSLAKGRQTVGGPLCIAPDIPGADLVRAVKRFMQIDLQHYPADKSLAAGGFVLGALMTAYPCPKSN